MPNTRTPMSDTMSLDLIITKSTWDEDRYLVQIVSDDRLGMAGEPFAVDAATLERWRREIARFTTTVFGGNR